MGFREELKRLRESADASYAELDRAVGRTNYVARVERGELPIPDRQVIMQLGDRLRELGAKTSASELWAVAVPEVAAAIDPSVRGYLESHGSAAGSLSDSEAALLADIREVAYADAAFV